jgi:diguanylate cyclase (GGDEF)-like protein/PAS domain S-box-containing protein
MAPQDGTFGDLEKRATRSPRDERRGVVRGVAILCLAIFAVDLYVPTIVAMSGLYVVPILMSLWISRPRFTIGVASVCTLLGVVALIDGFLDASATQVPAHELITNHAVVLAGLWIVVSLGLMRLRVERELAESRETTATTLRSIADGVITTDIGGRVSFLNAVAEKLTGWSREQALGQPLESIFCVFEESPLTPPLEELEGRDEASSPPLMRAKLRTREGRLVQIEKSLAPIRDLEPQEDEPAERGSVVVFRDVSERARREEDMKRLAYRDELTGLPNRNSLTDRLALELAHARRNRGSLAVLFVDLDDFKGVNDSFGHHAGDELLRRVAARLRDALRECDTVARLGGDEFTVLLPGVGSTHDAKLVAEKLLQALAIPVAFEGQLLRTHASIGIAIHPRDGDDSETILRRADEAMYRAKSAGGACHASVA